MALNNNETTEAIREYARKAFEAYGDIKFGKTPKIGCPARKPFDRAFVECWILVDTNYPHFTRDQQLKKEQHERYREKAKRLPVKIGDGAKVILGENGVYVQGWVSIPIPGERDEDDDDTPVLELEMDIRGKRRRKKNDEPYNELLAAVEAEPEPKWQPEPTPKTDNDLLAAVEAEPEPEPEAKTEPYNELLALVEAEPEPEPEPERETGNELLAAVEAEPYNQEDEKDGPDFEL